MAFFVRAGTTRCLAMLVTSHTLSHMHSATRTRINALCYMQFATRTFPHPRSYSPVLFSIHPNPSIIPQCCVS